MYKIGVIGSGYMAKEHIKAITSLKQKLEVTSIFGRNQETAKQLASEFNLDIIQSLEDFVSADLDVVVIAVSENSTLEILHKILPSRAVILIEKPIGISHHESQKFFAQNMMNLANTYAILNRRYLPSTIQLQKILNEQSENRRIVRITDQQNQIAALEAKQPKNVIAQWMYANSIHLIDLINFYCRGKLINVETNSNYELNTFSLVNSTLYYDSGDIATYSAIWNSPGRWTVNVNTLSGSWLQKPLESLYFQGFESHSEIEVAKEYLEPSYVKPGLYNFYLNLIRKLDGQYHQLVKFEDYLDSSNLIEEIYGK